MANYYCSSSFVLPCEWPEEAKKLFYNLVTGMCTSDSAEELEKVFSSNDIHEDEATIADLYDNYATFEYEIHDGNYYFWNMDNFNVDVTEVLLDIVTEKFKIPYENRIEVSYCWGCDRPRPDAFGGSKIISWYNPKTSGTVVPSSDEH